MNWSAQSTRHTCVGLLCFHLRPTDWQASSIPITDLKCVFPGSVWNMGLLLIPWLPNFNSCWFSHSKIVILSWTINTMNSLRIWTLLWPSLYPLHELYHFSARRGEPLNMSCQHVQQLSTKSSEGQLPVFYILTTIYKHSCYSEQGFPIVTFGTFHLPDASKKLRPNLNQLLFYRLKNMTSHAQNYSRAFISIHEPAFAWLWGVRYPGKRMLI